MATNGGTYKVEAACNNCGYSGAIELEKGTRVGQAKCPTCGCQGMTLARKGE